MRFLLPFPFYLFTVHADLSGFNRLGKLEWKEQSIFFRRTSQLSAVWENPAPDFMSDFFEFILILRKINDMHIFPLSKKQFMTTLYSYVYFV